jgi:hypothetical protein
MTKCVEKKSDYKEKQNLSNYSGPIIIPSEYVIKIFPLIFY